MSAVVRLPTAAPRYVAQPRLRVRRDAVSAAISAGSVVSFPGEFIPQQERAARAQSEADAAIYEAAGLTRSPAMLLASAIMTTLSADQHAGIAAFLGLCPSDDPVAVATLHWAEKLSRNVALMRAFGIGETER